MLLVTGITGHTGSYFLQELIDHKYEDQSAALLGKHLTLQCWITAD